MYKYAKENLKRIPLDVPKEKYEEIKMAANETEEKVNTYIKRVIDHDMYKETIYLNSSIMLNQRLQEELEALLLENHSYLNSYSKETSSAGEYRLVLYFIRKTPENDTIRNKFCELLEKYKILHSHKPFN